MKSNNRINRINDEISRELSVILRTEVKDPRIGVMTTVVRSQTTSDLKFCKVYVSIMGNDDEKKEVMQGLKNAASFIRHLIAERINLRHTPELTFIIDDSLEYSIKMSKLINEVSKNTKSGDVHD